MCRTVGLSLDFSLEHLTHRRNVASLSLSVGITVVGIHLNWLTWLHFRILEGGILIILIDSLISVTVPRCYKDFYINSFFPRTARLWNFLPIECFPLNSDLNGFMSRINKHLLTVFSVCINLFVLLFCNSMPCSGCSTLHGVNPSFKRKKID